MTKHNLPELSENTIAELLALREANTDEFHALIYALRLAGWPLRAIAVPLGVSRTAVSNWESQYTQTAPLPDVEALPDVPVKDRTPGSKKHTLTEAQITQLRDLAHKASVVRRYTDINAPSRRAGAELEALLYTYSEGGISYAQLANYCGVSRSAITQRLGKSKNGA